MGNIWNLSVDFLVKIISNHSESTSTAEKKVDFVFY